MRVLCLLVRCGAAVWHGGVHVVAPLLLCTSVAMVMLMVCCGVAMVVFCLVCVAWHWVVHCSVA